MNLEERWISTWQKCGGSPPDGLFAELSHAYRQPHRAYHNLQHITECFTHLDHCSIQPEDPIAFELALWFHDAIYDPKAKDNEEQSAQWAERSMTQIGAEQRRRIRELILMTKHNAIPMTGDEQLLTDIDLAILGADDLRFDDYETQIRIEYNWVPETEYRLGRLAILNMFLTRDHLYNTTYFWERFETRARLNLRRSIERFGLIQVD